MNLKKYAIIPLAVIVLGVFYLGLMTGSMVFSGAVGGLNYEGIVCHEVTRADGTVEDYGCNHNVLTNVGKNLTISQLMGVPTAQSANDNVSTMQLGNTSNPQASDTSHPGVITDCGLAEYEVLSWSPTGTSDGNLTSNHQWTSSCDNVVVNTTGLVTFTTNTYFAGNAFTNVTLQSNDQLTVTWYVWVT